MSWASFMSNPQYLAQAGHFLGGAMAVFVASVFWGEQGALWTLFIGTALAAIKEFILDVAAPPWGEGDSWSDSAMDFAFYVIGGSVGFGLFVLAVYEHKLPGAT